MLVWVATSVIWISTLKDLSIAGFHPLWFWLRIGYLPFILAVFAFTRWLNARSDRFYELPIWGAGFYVTGLCSVVASQSGYLSSHAVLGLLLLYLGGAMLPITRFSYLAITFFSMGAFVSACVAFGGPSVLRDGVVLSNIVPFIVFAYLTFFIIERIRSSRRRAQSRLAFVTAQVAHDIRSPLAALETAIRILPELDEANRSLLQQVAGRIRRIAEDLREPSPSVEHSDSCDLAVLVDSILEEKRLSSPAVARITLRRTDSFSAATRVGVSACELARVVSNLLNNAIESIEGAGSVTLQIEDQGARACLKITDSGKGIAPEILPRLMRRGATFGKRGGAGLGLAHARETLERAGGSISLTSTLGSGTEVMLWIPYAQAKDHAPRGGGAR